MSEAQPILKNFIRDIVAEDLATGKHSKIITRFPPEPNGYLHIGHAKSIVLNFTIARDYNGQCNLRFDDTNPEKESLEYIESIQRDVQWLGFDWGDNLYYASDYFDVLHDYAVELIMAGKAYVCDLSPEEIRSYRGTLTEAGKNSPWRERSVEENRALFARMVAGEFSPGEKVLRAKIDMASPNITMRDPVIYRIAAVPHHRAGDTWKVYPMYDFTHPLSDAQEGVTHSLCTLEFEDHRPLYNWLIENLNTPATPRQIEFARLNLTYTVMSKRKLLRLVTEGHVDSWDDPRMITISGMRRRGYPAEAIIDFCQRIGVAKRDSMVDFALLEHCVRTALNKTALRFMGVLDPIKVVIENYDSSSEEYLCGVNNPENEADGTRDIPFCRELYIERSDFMEDPPKKFFRLAPGREVRLRYAYFITCTDVRKDESGKVVEIRATYDPATKGGNAPDGRKVKGTIHWVSARHSVDATVRLYETLFSAENPDKAAEDGKDFTAHINPNSRTTVSAKVEPALLKLGGGKTFQFERLGYFIADEHDSSPENLVLNRTATLRDTWAKIQKQRGQKKK
ncbi:glutamine--tRNA ligase/YqeY domain fusion protein [Chitinivibrio alkaliphilus]|uniref:Glutamine--tRNA ligase n=1 Tax=Chitinivibrio alkaliphilus ACht1 TaxID=1313304 RepID=U7D671_9BACT|nr:glutamine--tRNA ligase/YqeY domain fusion protein [Chitinivibrio alkaliphilus]ERP32014.1 glutaminyl-tRNA synthetase [Chitinivibrio alkaliphilus ACht1]